MSEQVRVGNGAQWFGCGWRIFKVNAVTWMLIVLVLIALGMVAGFVPFFGSLAFMLAMPVLLGAIYRMAAGDRPVEVGGLFELFSVPDRRNALFVVGLILFGVSLMLTLTLGLAILSALPDQWAEAPEPDPQALVDAILNLRGLLMFVVLMLAQLVLSFSFFFAVGEVVFRGAAAVAAFKTGAQAAIANLLPALVFGVIYVALSFVAILAFGLGLIVLIPVTLLAGYCAYQDVLAGGRDGAGGQLTA